MISSSLRNSSRRLPLQVYGAAATRHFRSGAVCESPAAPAPATAGKHGSSSGGLLSFLLGGRKSEPLPPMYEPLAGVPVLPPTAPAPPADTQVTVLANGVKIASQDVPGPAATLGVYVDSGSVRENLLTSGVSNVLERMAYKSTANRTHFRLVREIEAIGANMLSSASREQMAYTADVAKTLVPEALEILVDTVRNPVFNEWEVKEQVDKLSADVAAFANNPQAMLVEALHSAGYAGALGNPLIASPSSLARIDGQLLFDFVAENYQAPRIVVAGAGVEHETFKALVEPLLADLPTVPAAEEPKSQYVGGDWRMASESPLTHFALGFEFAGGWRNEKESITLIVMQTLLGGGGSFSAGGPGKGMYSRLYTRVLNKHEQAQSCTAFNSVYNDTGLFGIMASAEAGFIPDLVGVVVQELHTLATPGKVSDAELQRAKNATVSSVLMNLESRAVVAEDIGRQILTYGHRKHPQTFIDAVNNTTPADITTLAQKIIKTPLSFAAYGNVVHVPRFDEVAAQFS